MTETVIIFVYIMIELIRFVCYLNPNTIKEKGSLDKDSIDAEYKTKTVESEPSENFSPFITDYNLLEKLLKDFACFLIEPPNSTYKIQIFEALDRGTCAVDESGSGDELSGHEKDGNASWNHGGGDDTGNDLRKACRRASRD